MTDIHPIYGATAADSSSSAALASRALESYARIAATQAEDAAQSGTFGVGGLLVDLDGNILCANHNRVIEDGAVSDPTAHGERQIVDWYLANREKESLPAPDECVLITTVDPCVMCTGALALAGFRRVVVIALDGNAGINYQGDVCCCALNGASTQEYVKAHFSYPEVIGDAARPAFGAPLDGLPCFDEITITTETLRRCERAFDDTQEDVRGAVSSSECAPTMNPAELPCCHPMRRHIERAFGGDCFAVAWLPDQPAQPLLDCLRKKRGADFEGVAFFDSFGNLICAESDDEDIASQSAFMKVTRKYAQARNAVGIDGYAASDFLPNPQLGYFVYTDCPDLTDKTIMEIGAIGSTLEGKTEHPVYYLRGEENQAALDKVLAQLPPLYSHDIGVRFQKAFQ